MCYELADYEWAAIEPMLPKKPREVPRVNDRCVLNGIFWVDLRRRSARTPLSITASFAGGGLVSGAVS
jgi:transposase